VVEHAHDGIVLNRSDFVSAASEGRTWDVVVVGGGATGLGAAVEAAARGYSTLLLEQADFAKGTSSRSTKLIHGGVRYLQQGDVSLVLEALRERGLLIQNAPHLVHHLAFVVPVYDWWEGPFYGIGLRLYDTLAGKLGLGPSRNLSREETLERIPTLEPDGLRGGVIYYDGQFDDSRLAVTLMRTLADLGGVPLNYARVTGLVKSGGSGAAIEGVMAVDGESGRELEIRARVVVNATGVFTDEVRRMDNPGAAQMVTPGRHGDHGPPHLRRPCAVRRPVARPRDRRHDGYASPGGFARAETPGGGGRVPPDARRPLPHQGPPGLGRAQRVRRTQAAGGQPGL